MDRTSEFSEEPDLAQLASAHAKLRTNPDLARVELAALAERGSVMSMLYLGFAAQKGRGQLRDLKQAEYWYCTAYKKGSLTALTYYGRILFRQGKFEQAEQVFRSGVVIDDQSSMYWLANVYLQYNGLDPRAIELLTRACARGHIFARRKLGGLMLKGRCGWKQIPNGARLVITAIIDGVRLADPKRPNRSLM